MGESNDGIDRTKQSQAQAAPGPTHLYAPIRNAPPKKRTWRFFYYGDFLPNTYYAKVGGFSWERSRFYLDSFFSGYHLYGFIPLGIVAIWARRDFTSALFATAVAVNLAYLTWIGGDFLEYRFLVPILPYLYWLVVDGVRAIATLEIGAGWRRALPRAAAAVVVSALLAGTILGSASDQTWSVGRGIEGVAASRFYAEVRIGQGRLLRSLIDGGALPRELRWQTRGAGAIPYYTGWYTLDTLGLNDRYVARQPLRPGSHGRVGHQRHAPLEYSRAKKVQLLPVGQQFLFTVPEHEVAELKRGFEKRWKASAGGERESVIHCRKVVPGAFLFFRTTVSDAELESLFGGLDRC